MLRVNPRVLSALTIISLLLALTVPANAAQRSETRANYTTADVVDASQNESADSWFVELTGAAESEGGNAAANAAEQQAFAVKARAAGANFTERIGFSDLWNGLSVRASAADAAIIRRVDGVRAIWPVIPVSMPTTTAISPDLATALSMTGADVAQNELGFSGKGVRVAIMDTGVDYQHPDLGGCFGAGCRVAKGWDFVGDAFNADPASPAYNPVPVPDPDPDDCNGHGTHVAGIVGAKAASATGVTGVAPGVTFGAYRVFGCNGSTTADIMLAAMERVRKDKMDVLNMSIGSSFQWPQYPTALGADRLAKSGIVVAASIGNSGANGLYAAGAPGLGERVIGVAAFDNTNSTLTAFSVTPGGNLVGYTPAAGAPVAPTTGSLTMARTGTATTANDACNAVAPAAGSLTGKAALVRRGTCSFYEKARNAQSAGAAAVVLYNNAPGALTPTVAGSPAITIPVVMISQVDGNALDAKITAGTTSLTWTAQTVTNPVATAGRISSFSSYGLSPDLALKPDIGAPGGLIRSTLPLEQGGYGSLSGTSMSSPHVAGAAALFLEARPRTKPEQLREILQNSADPALWWGNPALGFLDNVQRQGAGMLDIDDAIEATTFVTPGKLALGETSGAVTKRIEIRNDSNIAKTYTITHAPALATGPNTFTVGFLNAPATVVFSQTTVTVNRRQDRRIDVTIAPNAALPDKSLYGGYIVVTSGTGETYRVPYAGFKGDYQSIVAMTPTPNGFPWLAKIVGPSFVNQPAGATYTMVGADIAYFLVHLDHQVQRMTWTATDVATGRTYRDPALDEELLPRNSTATTFFAFAWDGTLVDDRRPKELRNGTYTLKLVVEKALAERRNPAHLETFTFPNITINRPDSGDDDDDRGRGRGGDD